MKHGLKADARLEQNLILEYNSEYCNYVERTGTDTMKSDDIYILKDLEKFQSITEALKDRGLTCEYRILDKKIIESNRYISRMLKIPLASKVFYFEKLRIVENIPKL